MSAFVGRKSAVIGYARVSKFPGCEIVRDIGSGLNFKRRGLRALLERAMQGESLTVCVTYRDRLARFGFDLVEQIITRAGGKVVVLHQIETSPVAELTQDLTAILVVFSSRLHGLRSHKDKKNLAETLAGTKAEAQAVDGELP